MTEARWVDRPFFAEIAEALSIDTTMIMAAFDNKGQRYHVLYTPDYPEDPTIHSVWLQRGVDDIFIKISKPMPHPGMWEEIEEKLKAHMEELKDE